MKNIKFETRQDYIQALHEMCDPLKKYYSKGNAFIQTGYTATHYGNKTIGLEGFSRVLWGLVPLWAGGDSSCLDSNVIEGIRNGSNPKHEEYWGNYKDGEQAFVEMAVIGLGLLLTPNKIWEPLSDREKTNFNQWLSQINSHLISDNNWLFFRVLVNLGLKNVNAVYSKEQLETDLQRIDDFYLGDGWYSDGATKQVDYYIGFAFHFYALIYAKVMNKEDSKRANKYIERAKLFAKDYIYWFGERGEGLPFGRSLGYRFAQGSFWCALAFAEVDVLPWGIIKGIVNRHLRYWFSNPILDTENKLTLGYAYPNITVGEGYNSPNSPYWAFKSFLVLALDENHPFWQTKEEPLPTLEATRLLKHPRMIIQRSGHGYLTALTSGQYAEWEPVHCAEKYGKFAYSSYFGFQVPRSYYNLAQAAPDNMLAFLRDDYYHVRRRCDEICVENDKIYSKWRPMNGVTVETEIIPCGIGHIRKHTIHATSSCKAVEGGFALPIDEIDEFESRLDEKSSSEGKVSVLLAGPKGSSKVELIQGEGKGNYILCEANVNLLHPRTVLPYIEYEISEGITQIEVYIEGIPGVSVKDKSFSRQNGDYYE
jgi:hypothetical protein